MTDSQIKQMVSRFLQWKLPESFNPDGGISFARICNADTPFASQREPVGTNLLDAQQAEEMVRFLLEGTSLLSLEGGWRDIASAPKDGTKVRLAWCPDDWKTAEGLYRDGEWIAAPLFYRNGKSEPGKPHLEFRELRVDPSCWMPLVSPPTSTFAKPTPSSPVSSPSPAGGVREALDGKRIAGRVLQRILDFDDRTSPEDQPDMLLVTGQELTDLIEEEISDAALSSPATGEVVVTDDMIDAGCAAWVKLYPAFKGEKPPPTAGDVVKAILTAALNPAPGHGEGGL